MAFFGQKAWVNPFKTSVIFMVFRYSFLEAKPIFFNRLKSGFHLVRSL